MRTFRINQLVCNHQKSWNKWPDTDDKDYSSVLEERWFERYVVDDCEYLIENRWYPVYLPYADTGLQPVVKYDWIDNTTEPQAEVVASSIKWLTELSRNCHSVYWWHAWNCWPAVMREFIFHGQIMCLHFGDDCPGSSHAKTFPIANWFDSIVYSMYIFDGDGTKTGDIYMFDYRCKPYHAISGASSGLEKRLQEIGFSVAQKASSVADGFIPSIDFSFVGFGGGTPWRCKVISDMQRLDWSDLHVRLHGTGMRDGILEPRLPIVNCGAACADMYVDTMFSVNLQQSSLFTTRLVDLWNCGVVQLMCDPHGELAENGIKPFVHYLPFNGTAEDVLETVMKYKDRYQELAEIIVNGAEISKRLMEEKGPSNVIAQMYHDHKDFL